MAEAHAFGRYRVTGTLGAGGMGEVFAAVDEVLGREVAVKILRGKHSGLAARLLDERFRQEARAIAALAHPGVVQVFDIDLAAEVPYIVMERVVGPSLKERLSGGPLQLDELRALGIQIGRALAAAHAAGIVHRDVKPANILVASTHAVGGGSTWKLADFGVAHVPDSAITMTGQFVGSPAYAAPEALVRGQTGPAGDVYGLGATLYEAACGRWPRCDATSGALLGPVPPLAALAPHLPPELAAAIDRAVAQELEARPTAADFADALAGASSMPGAVGAVSLPGGPPPAAMKSGVFELGGRRRWWYVATVVGVILLIGVIAAIATRRTSPPSSKPPTTTTQPGSGRPSELRVVPPEIAREHGKAGKDWRKVVEKLQEQKFGEARRKLDEFERRWGDSEETRSLREQLKAIPMLPEDGKKDD